MQPFQVGIYSIFNAGGDLKTALTGGLHEGLAPQGTDLPYGTYNILPSRPEYSMGGEVIEIVNVQFDLYSESNAERATLYSYLIALYDEVRPTITGYRSIIMERQYQQLLRAGDQNEQFRAIIEYQIKAEKI